MLRIASRFACLLIGIVVSILPASAQLGGGFPPFGSFSGGPFDTIDNANLNIHFEIPIVSKAGRGLPFKFAMNYDSSHAARAPAGGHAGDPFGGLVLGVQLLCRSG